MRRSNWRPSIVPGGNDETVYLVADDFGKIGRAWRETDCETADLEQSAHFDDSIALATWPMELRETNRGARLRFPIDGQPCDIPLGALRARDHANVFSAGRCISCSHEAQASIRVIGTCLATGEAAGIAAALFALRGECDAPAVRQTRAEISHVSALR